MLLRDLAQSFSEVSMAFTRDVVALSHRLSSKQSLDSPEQPDQSVCAECAIILVSMFYSGYRGELLTGSIGRDLPAKSLIAMVAQSQRQLSQDMQRTLARMADEVKGQTDVG